jgi:hypothetical protein
MRLRRITLALGTALLCWPGAASAQQLANPDPVLQSMWQEGMENSQTYPLAQALLDSIGPRLTGTPGFQAAGDWLVAMYGKWGIRAHNEQYGTWKGWQRGISHIDLVEPRVRTLEGMMLAWSPGTRGKARADVVILPDLADSTEFQAWLPEVEGKFVLISMPQPTCRPDADWEEQATEESFERMKAKRDTARQAWRSRVEKTGTGRNGLAPALEAAGAAGVVSSNWSSGWGARRIFAATTEQVPTFDLSCEDYGLVFRLAKHGQNPVLEVEFEAEWEDEVPLFNTIAAIRGSEKPDEYIVLSAHLDSWDGGSGATDNGTGTIMMLEAMRIIQATYPNPKRSIIVGHWNSEEQGLNGSRAFAADNPEIVDGMHVLFNEDNGTGRIMGISMQGLNDAGSYFARWMGMLPFEITSHIEMLMIPGTPSGGGTDNASFICSGAPAFGLFATRWNYFTYTWHTELDTFDKVVFDDLMNNATLTAMLVYLADQESVKMSRDQVEVLPPSRFGRQQRTWPECRDAMRTWEAYRSR